jgi:hypothetical protein
LFEGVSDCTHGFLAKEPWDRDQTVAFQIAAHRFTKVLPPLGRAVETQPLHVDEIVEPSALWVGQ